MPQNQSNQLARVAAVVALFAALVLTIVVIAGSGGDSDDGGSGDAQAESEEPTRRGERALERGIWVVREGDTLVSISESTGIEIDDLLALNPEIDPQAVVVGQRLILREGVEAAEKGTDAGGSPGADATGVGDEGPTGTGVGDEGPTGAGTSDSDGFAD